MKRIIKLLEVPKKKSETFDANFMEDTALILKSTVREDGYLNPTIVITAFRENEKKGTRYFWNETEPSVSFVMLVAPLTCILIFVMSAPAPTTKSYFSLSSFE